MKKSLSKPPKPPAIILLAPQLGENIGTAARAMHNFALTDLRLVAPRAGWSQAKAQAAAAGGAEILAAMRVYDQLEEALADLRLVIAATARPRDMNKTVMPPHQAVQRCRAQPQSGILFGPERSGLDNEACALCDALVQIPANPDFSSLNLAQAVLIMGFHWFTAAQGGGEAETPLRHGEILGKKGDLIKLFAHLEQELDGVGFFHPPAKRAIMRRNLRNVFHRAGLSDAEIRALRGVIAALVGGRKEKKREQKS